MSANVSIIISTYNSPDWLQKVLCGFNIQSYKNFEIIIADDGSTEETSTMVKEFSKSAPYIIKHIWHEDNGFQKTKILNEALKSCETDYVIMTDGDCIPLPNFVETHIEKRQKNRFLSGGYHKLSMNLSKKTTTDDILTKRCFDVNWLIQNGMKKSFKNHKIISKGFKSSFLNFITPTKPTWNGHNSSGWLKDIIKVNGFDERMEYGGEDRELGERLENLGVKGKKIRYNTTCLHLDHSRGYVNKEALAKNIQIRRETRTNKSIWTNFGIQKSK